MPRIQDLLTTDLCDEITKRGTVVWLDRDAHYGAFAADLAKRSEEGGFPYPVIPFEGSYLELMMKLESYGNGLDPDRLLIHMPGHNESTVKETPVLELYASGYRYRKALDTLIKEAAAGRVDPEVVDAYLRGGDVTLAGADAWLGEQLATATGIASALRRMTVTAVLDDLLSGGGALLREGGEEDPVSAVQAYLHRSTGMTDDWVDTFPPDGGLPKDAQPRDRLTRAVCGWVLCAEYAHDLRREAPEALKEFNTLSAPLAKASRGLAEHLRTRHPRQYEQVAKDTEALLGPHLEAPADVLGDIDTFPFEEETIRKAAIDALRSGQWDKAAAWATERRVEEAFWLRTGDEHARKLKWTWAIIRSAAALGMAIQDHPVDLVAKDTLRKAVDRYAEQLHAVDRTQRHFEQCWHDMGDALLYDYTELREAARRVRAAYRGWADELARVFSAMCNERGFLPESDLQQRGLYDHVIHPLTADGSRVAVFLVDALRYEMAVGLADDLQTAGAVVDLKPRLAELPTITSVGMNALAPVSDKGLLDVVLRKNDFGGFRTGEYTVRDPKGRARAMGSRSAGKPALELRLEKVADLSLPDLKRTISRGPSLIVVHSLEIDGAGEAGFGLATFDRTLRQIRTAANQLQKAGVTKIVITADHGFLLRDEEAAVATYGSKADAHRRHVLTDERREEKGLVTVSLSELGYRVEGEHFLMFREDTATTNEKQPFVHGGNSLQERVIPVIVLQRKRKLGESLTSYRVTAQRRNDLMGWRRLRLRVELEQKANATFDFTGSRAITLAVRPLRDDVTVTIADVDGPAKLEGSRLKVPVGGDWSEIFFALEGDHPAPVRVEVYHPDAAEQVQTAAPKEFFDVAVRKATTAKGPGGTSTPPPSESAPAPASKPKPNPEPAQPQWHDAIEHEGFRRVFMHIDQHGSITEADMRQVLGSARSVRIFARRFDGFLALVPFRVRVESTGTMKAYVKEGG